MKNLLFYKFPYILRQSKLFCALFYFYILLITMTRKWLKGALTAMFTLAGIGLMVGLSQAAILSFQGVTETGEDLTISDTYFYSGCYTPVKIMINPEWVETHAVDAKFFTTGSFELQLASSDYLTFVPWVFSNYLTWTVTEWQDTRIWEGTATVWTIWDYYYINAYTDTGDFISGANAQDYATIYVKPLASATSGYLDFYFQWSAVNDDDSNVASGINNNTQYEDALTSIAWTGEWTIETTNIYECRYNPYIIEWSTYDSTLGTDLTDAYNTNINDTSLASLPAYRVFTTTTPYEWTISHMAGNDYTTGDYTSENSWNIWTNQAVVITISGNTYDYAGTQTGDFKMVTGTFASSDITLSSMVGSDDTRTTSKTITITGNVETGISFYNRLGNYGSYFQSGVNYFDTFMIDIFRYDNTPTTVTWLILWTGDGYEVIALSGYASSTEVTEHANWTIDDDKFRIIKFSGHNTTKYGQPTTTSYNDDLNDLYANNQTNQNFNMVKSGNYQTNDLTNLISTDTGAIVFTETRSGYIRYSDIAGNVSGVYVEVDIDKLVEFEIQVNPAYRNAVNNLSTTGELRIAQSADDGATRTFTHKFADGDDKVVINENGTGSVKIVIPSSGNQYLAVFKGTGYLSIGFTGIWQNDPDNTSTNYLDFSGWTTFGTKTVPSGGRLYSNTYYLLYWDLETAWANYDLIETANELTLINNNLEVGTNDLSSIYRYDADLNDVINAVEQAIVIQDNMSYGFIGSDFVSPLDLSDFNTAS